MSVKPETTFRHSVEKLVPASVYRLKLNLPFSGGVADSWYSGKKADLWVEYKYLPKLPIRASVKIGLSALQLLWLEGRYAEGRNLAVIVGYPSGGVILRDLQWEQEFDPAAFMDHTVSKAELALFIVKQTAI